MSKHFNVILLYFIAFTSYSVDSLVTMGDVGLTAAKSDCSLVIGGPEVWLNWDSGLGLLLDPYEIALPFDEGPIQHEICDISLFWSPRCLRDNGLWLGPRLSSNFLLRENKLSHGGEVGIFFNWAYPLPDNPTSIPLTFRIIEADCSYSLATGNFKASFSFDLSLVFYTAVGVYKGIFEENRKRAVASL